MNCSIHIGVNKYDKNVWGADADLRGCVADAVGMSQLAREYGYARTEILLDTQATKHAVTSLIAKAAKEMMPGETCLISFSGHGTQVRDKSGEEFDGLDEAICLHDDALYDDELVSLLSQFKAGVNVNIVSDTCHSQDQVRQLAMFDDERPKFLKALFGRRSSKGLRPVVEASVIQYASCLSSEVSWDTDKGGFFTQKLLEIARNPRTRRSASFIDAVRREVKKQTPTLTLNNASRSHRMKKALSI